MQIIFDATPLHQSKMGSITGILYVDFGSTRFPEEGWNDFVVVVSTWWLEALAKLERGFEREVTLYFMDGPYWLMLTRQDGDDVQIRCIEDRTGGGVIHEELVSLQDFSKQLRRVARQVASACQRNRFESSDVDTLRKYLPN
jgi:hypothetical protein